MRHTTQHNVSEKRRFRAKRLLWAFVALALLVGLGLHSKASALGEDIGPVTTELSADRDPFEFAEELAVVMPRSVVPLNREDAVAQVLRRGSKTMTEHEVMQVTRALNDEAEALGYDPLIFVAVIRIESNFNHLAISPVGAEGLMQLMPPTAAWMADRADIDWPEGHSFDPVTNVRLGARYLAHLQRRFDGRMDLALTAYNRGPSATRYLVKRHGQLPKDIRDFYATKVLDKYRELRETYGHLPVS